VVASLIKIIKFDYGKLIQIINYTVNCIHVKTTVLPVDVLYNLTVKTGLPKDGANEH
jgi:hypothetical protein